MELNEFRYNFKLCHRGHRKHRVIKKIVLYNQHSTNKTTELETSISTIVYSLCALCALWLNSQPWLIFI